MMKAYKRKIDREFQEPEIDEEPQPEQEEDTGFDDRVDFVRNMINKKNEFGEED